jgi:general secretion pathway protein J
MDYKTKISTNIPRTIRLNAMRQALCSLPSSLRRAPVVFQRPPSSSPQLAIRNSQLATHNPQLSTRNSQHATRIPHPATRNTQPVSGFTLMEILLAFLILAIVISTILGSFNAVFSTTETLENSRKYFDMAKNCLNRMSLDLATVYVTQPPFYKKPEFDDPPDTYRIEGSNVDVGGIDFAILRFTSNAHIPLDNSSRDGIAEIVYYVQSKTDGQMVLKRADHLFPYPPFEEKGGDPVLCRHVKSLAFKYYDAEGEESEEWNSDTGDYDHATPTAIGIQLEIGNESESYTFETTVRLAVHRDKLD